MKVSNVNNTVRTSVTSGHRSEEQHGMVSELMVTTIRVIPINLETRSLTFNVIICD